MISDVSKSVLNLLLFCEQMNTDRLEPKLVAQVGAFHFHTALSWLAVEESEDTLLETNMETQKGP